MEITTDQLLSELCEHCGNRGELLIFIRRDSKGTIHISGNVDADPMSITRILREVANMGEHKISQQN